MPTATPTSTAVSRRAFAAAAMLCLLCVMPAAFAYKLTGIVRDFSSSDTANGMSAATTDPNAAAGTRAWVQDLTGADFKPKMKIGYAGTAITPTSAFSGSPTYSFNWFSDSYTTSAGGGYGTPNFVVPYSIEAVAVDANNYGYLANPFYPIDGLLGDAGLPGHNTHFSFELHTFVTYKGNTPVQTWTFYASDDLYVYMNGYLCGCYSSLHGFQTYTMNPATCAVAAGLGTPPSAAVTVRLDMFYVHRSGNVPAFGFAIPDDDVCNVASSSIIDKTFTPYSAANVAAGGKALIVSPTQLQLTQSGQALFTSSVWSQTKKRVYNGWSTSFAFQVTGQTGSNTDGFAFCVQGTQGTAARGSAGGSLAYNLPGMLCVEFDMYDDGSDDPTAHHVEVHTGYAGANGPGSSLRIGGTAFTSSLSPSVTMNDGAIHRVRIVCATDAAGASAGVVVYFDQQLLLTVTGLQYNTLRNLWGGLAYVGFTASTDTFTSNILVTEWQFYTTPISALETTFAELVSPFGTSCSAATCTVLANNQLNPALFKLIVKDGCGQTVSVGGESLVAMWTSQPGGIAATTDNGDGSYSVQYANTLAGSPQKLRLLLNSQDVITNVAPGLGLSITTNPNIISPTTSSFTPVITSIVAGTTRLLTVTAFDVYNNPVVSNTAPLTVQIVSDTFVRDIQFMKPVSSNQYVFPIQFNISGPATVYVRTSGVAIGTPFAMLVNASSPVGGGSYLTGLGAITPAGQPAQIRLYMRDIHNNPVQTRVPMPNIQCTMTLTSPPATGTLGCPGTWVPQAGSVDAYWDITKSANIAGGYTLSIQLNFQQVVGTTGYSDQIIPTVANVQSTIVRDGVTTQNVAGDTYTYTIQGKDSFSNTRVTVNDVTEVFTVRLTAPGQPFVTADCTTGATVAADSYQAGFSCSYTFSGRYQVSFRTLFASPTPYSIQAFVNGVNFNGPALTFVTVPTVMDASTTTIASFPIGIAANPGSLNCNFTITARDVYGNQLLGIVNEANKLTALITNTVTAATIDLSGAIIDQIGPFTYRQRFSTTISGTYSIRVYVNGIAIGGAVPTQTIVPAATVAANTQVTGLGPGVENALKSFDIQARDIFGNFALSIVDTWSLVVVNYGGTPTTPPPTCPNLSSLPGKYRCSYTLPAYTTAAQAFFNVTLRFTSAGGPVAFRGSFALSLSTDQQYAVINGVQLAGPNFVPGVVTEAPTAPNMFSVRQVNNLFTPTNAPASYFFAITGPCTVTQAVAPQDQISYIYQISYKCTTPGTYQVSLTASGTPVQMHTNTFGISGSVPLVVSPGIPSSISTPAPEINMRAGLAVSFNVQVQDVYHNNVVTNPGTLSLVITKTTTGVVVTDCTQATCTGGSGGAYSCTVNCNKAEAKTIRYSVNGTPLAGAFSGTGLVPSSTSLLVAAGIPDQTKTLLQSGQLTTAADVNCVVRYTFRDSFNNDITGPYNIKIQLAYNPTVEFSYVESAAGGYSFTIKPFKTPVTDVIFPEMWLYQPDPTLNQNNTLIRTPMIITPAQQFDPLSFVTGLPTTNLPLTPAQTAHVRANTPITFSLNARDKFNNPLSNKVPLLFSAKVVCTLPNGSPLPSIALPNAQVAGPGTVDATNQGVFKFAYTPTIAGSYLFSVSFSNGTGTPTPFSPTGITVVVVVADFATSMTIVVANGRSVNQGLFLASSVWPAGQPQIFTAQMTDRFGNKLTYAGSALDLNFLRGPVTCNPTLDQDLSSNFFSPSGRCPGVTAKVDLGNGLMNFTLCSTIAGSYAFNLSVNGYATRQCSALLSFVINPLAYDASQSLLSGAGLTTGVAGTYAEVVLTYMDKYKNKLLVDPSPPPVIKLGERPVGWSGQCAPEALWLKDTLSSSFFSTAMNISTSTEGDGAFASKVKIRYAPRRAGILGFILTLDGNQAWTAVTPCPTVSVANSRVNTVNGPATALNATAAIPTSLVVSGFDEFLNPVFTVELGAVGSGVYDHTFLGDFQLLGSTYKFTVNSQPNSLGVAGSETHQMNYIPVWAGTYQANIKVKQTGSTSDSLSNFILQVSPATCGEQTAGAAIFRCLSDRKCVAAYTSCVGAPTVPVQAVCSGALPVSCNGYCIASGQYCPPRTVDNCPPHAPNRCPSGECRLNVPADCPSATSCQPGYVVCPDSITCAANLGACPAVATTCPTLAPGVPALYACMDGSCVTARENCPTQTTCPDTQVVCPDGSCRPSGTQCFDQYLCYAPTPVRCQDGTCRRTLDQCPSRVVCPIGWVKCEGAGCAPTASQCTNDKCSNTEVRCPNGECRPNLNLCSSPVTCSSPADGQLGLPSKIRCADGSCAASVWHCSQPRVCGTGLVTCADGSCVSTLSQCMTQITCPPEAPVHCPDHSCATTTALCRDFANCTSSRPIRCANGACVRALSDCPIEISGCSGQSPVRCPDGACATSVDQCSPLAAVSCPVVFNPVYPTNGPIRWVRCPSGTCAPTYGQCGTAVSCGLGLNRCADGSCRESCVVVNRVQCANTNVTCPAVVYGGACAPDLSSCPTSVACPPEAPVKCIDGSCALSYADCPLPASYSPNKVTCQGASWAANQVTCGQSTTCPITLPAKCWDESCRRVAADCPPRLRCPPATPFACYDGSCYATLSDCRTSPKCDPGNSDAFRGDVKCPNFDSSLGPASAGCVSRLSDCDKYNMLTYGLDNPAQGFQQLYRCPNLAQRCRDGSCRSDPTQCPGFKCPAHLPVICGDGSCARAQSECVNSQTGCPHDLPAKCTDGSCALDAGRCASRVATLTPGVQICSNATGAIACPDGSCQFASTCKLYNPNGCPITQAMCADKSCTFIPTTSDQVSPCLSTAGTVGSQDSPNMCPSNRPFRCPDGYCALSSILCPIFPQEALGCSSVTPMYGDTSLVRPFRCADGMCALSFDQCRYVMPCTSGTRCPDGSCRESCPFFNPCPFYRPFRCAFSGLCAISATDCINDITELTQISNTVSPPLSRASSLMYMGGCPLNRVKCTNGYCRSTLEGTCPVPTRAANGCPIPSIGASSGKCFNGECAPTSGSCNLPNGCPAATPYFCRDGTCSATPCVTTGTTCPSGVRCPDGHCAASASACTSKLQCPLNAPYRCANGECRRYPAIVNGGALTPDPTKTCPSVVVCEQPTPELCADGSCVANSTHCRPTMPCQHPDYPQLCRNMQCIRSNETCAYDAACPPASSVLCPNGACRRSSSECTFRSTEEDKCTNPDLPILCFDGFCRAKYMDCIQTQFTASHPSDTFNANAQLSITACLAGEVLCSNGACLPSGSSCPLIPRCPDNAPLRCWDGSCVNATTCATTPVECGASNHVRCADGTCNIESQCPAFNGCPLSSPYFCAGLSSPCVATAGACADFLFNQNFEAQACDFNCYRDLTFAPVSAYPLPTEKSITIDFAIDKNGIVRDSLSVPAGAASTLAGGFIEVLPVSLYSLRDTITELNSFRQSQFGVATFSSYTSVKSTPFRLNTTGAGNLALGLTLTAYADIQVYSQVSGPAEEVAAVIAVPCEYQAPYQVERTIEGKDGNNQPVFVACSGRSDVTDDTVSLTMNGCDNTDYTGSVVSVEVIGDPYTVSNPTGQICVCYNLTQTNGAAALYPYSIGDQFCTRFKRTNDLVDSYTWFDRSQSSRCPTDAEFTAQTNSFAANAPIRHLIHTVLERPACVNADATSRTLIPAADICLARVVQVSIDDDVTVPRWQCVLNRDERLARPVNIDVATGQVLPRGLFTGSVPGPADSKTVWAFIHSPLPPAPEAERASESFWDSYGKIILITILTVGLFALIASYVTWRLIRYRRKYKINQAKKAELTDRRNNLEEFAGGLGIADEEVDMVANPLVIELQNLEQQIRKVNEEMGVQEARDAAAIDRLEADRKKLYGEIDRVKQAIQKAEAEAEAAAKTTAARETAANQARATAAAAASINAQAPPRVGSMVMPSDVALSISGAATGEGVAVDAGSGTQATTTAQGTTRLDFGQAKIRRPRDVSDSDRNK